MFQCDIARFSDRLHRLQTLCRQRNLSIVTAESCSGGLLGSLLTHLSGSSNVYKGGIIAYSNAIKESALRIPAEDIDRYGAVSENVALLMARRVRDILGGDYGLSITGIAGPSGGSPTKPVGTVWCGWSSKEKTFASVFHLKGDREAIRAESCWHSLDGLHQLILNAPN